MVNIPLFAEVYISTGAGFLPSTHCKYGIAQSLSRFAIDRSEGGIKYHRFMVLSQ